MSNLWAQAVHQWIEHQPKPSPSGYDAIIAHKNNKDIGRLDYRIDSDGDARIAYVSVQRRHRRQGIARSMYDAFHEKHPDVTIHHDSLTRDGLAMVRRLPPEWNHIPHKENLTKLVNKVGPTCNTNFEHNDYRDPHECWEIEHQAWQSCPVHEIDEE